jgi:hypothetical protein
MGESHDHRAETADLISQATEQVKERQKRRAEIELVQASAKPSRQRVSLALLIAAVPIFATLLVVGFTDWSFTALFETRPTGPAAREQAEKTLSGLVAEIEAFRHDYNELPERLIEIGIPPRGEWKYSVRGSDHYRVEGTLHGQRVVFDSTKRPIRAAKD